jgi:hypothetical protein
VEKRQPETSKSSMHAHFAESISILLNTKGALCANSYFSIFVACQNLPDEF